MFISKLVNWLDDVDPYAIQRVVLGKASFTATVLVYMYWFARPTTFLTFISPMLVVAFYEVPTLTTLKQKEQLLIFMFAATIFGSVSYYLMYPFRGFFFLYAVLFLMALYYLVVVHFGQLKNITMIIIATAAVTLSVKPPANLQIVYNMVSSALLSSVTIFVCLRIYPNQNLMIWRRAMQKFIACMESDIEQALQQKSKKTFANEVNHLAVVRAYRRLMPKEKIKHTVRIAIYIRNIQFALDNLYFENKNPIFWRSIQHDLKKLRQSMAENTACDVFVDLTGETSLQKYVVTCLQKAVSRWNRLTGCVSLKKALPRHTN